MIVFSVVTLVVLFISPVLLAVSLLSGNPQAAAFFFFTFLIAWHTTFRHAMNSVQTVGRFYIVLRDTGNRHMPYICRGFMRKLEPPYMYGKGPQIRIGKYVLQFGFGRYYEMPSEIEAILNAVGGREMEESPKEIGTWNAAVQEDSDLHTIL